MRHPKVHTQHEGDTVYHDGSPAHNARKVAVSNRTQFNHCQRCADWFLPVSLEGIQTTKRTLKLTGDSGAVKARQRIEQTIALVVAQSLLDDGYSLGVHDGDDITIHHSRDIDAIQKALFTTDEDYLYVYVKGTNPKDTRPDYWVRFVYGNDGWDVICDYSVHLESSFATVQKLIDYACDNGVVPDLYNKNNKIALPDVKAERTITDNETEWWEGD